MAYMRTALVVAILVAALIALVSGYVINRSYDDGYAAGFANLCQQIGGTIIESGECRVE